MQVGRCHSFYEALLDEVTKVNNLQQNTSIKWVELELNLCTTADVGYSVV